VAKARQAICERGQKLSEVEDRTEMMANEAKVTFLYNFLTPLLFPTYLGRV
jgi:hypothetical protein